ncbi:MAG TPA: tetratricopeptide repeat protein [Terriglobia bacterium]|nr:tetratricopeptide repeat protein [Terriglobia bacterium]
MEQTRNCPQCGQPIPPDRSSCPRCNPTARWLVASREHVLLLSFPVLLAMFVVTGFAARSYHAKQAALAVEWHLRGEADLKEGRAEQAIEDFRTALVYSRDSALYRLRLAQALIAASRADEARAYLLTLWEREPGNGTVNLELARLAAGKGDIGEAARYYHNAIFGVWEENPEERRRQVRLELCQLLVNRGARNEAQAALIELAGDLPKDPELYSRVGGLFLRTEDYAHALKMFRQALALDRKQEPALGGAGEAAFQMGNYAEARRYLERAVRVDSENARAVQLLDTANLVLEIDPFARGVSASARARRVVRAFRQALERLRGCAQKRSEVLEGPPPLTELQTLFAHASEMRSKVRESSLRRDSELMLSATHLVFEIEEFAVRTCGPVSGLDLALLLIGRKREGAES